MKLKRQLRRAHVPTMKELTVSGVRCMSSKLKLNRQERSTHLIRVKELGVKVQDTLQIKSADIEEFLWGDIGVHAA